MAHSGAYIRTARYFGGDKFWCEILDGKAFYYGIRGKAHFHLIAIAVRQEYQHQGIATKLLNRIMDRCRENGLNKIQVAMVEQMDRKQEQDGVEILTMLIGIKIQEVAKHTIICHHI